MRYAHLPFTRWRRGCWDWDRLKPCSNAIFTNLNLRDLRSVFPLNPIAPVATLARRYVLGVTHPTEDQNSDSLQLASSHNPSFQGRRIAAHRTSRIAGKLFAPYFCDASLAWSDQSSKLSEDSFVHRYCCKPLVNQLLIYALAGYQERSKVATVLLPLVLRGLHNHL